MAFFVEDPVVWYRLASLKCGIDLPACNRAAGDVEQNRITRSVRDGVGERIAAGDGTTRSRRRNTRNIIGHRNTNEALFGCQPCIVSGRTKVTGIANSDVRDSGCTSSLNGLLHRKHGSHVPQTGTSIDNRPGRAAGNDRGFRIGT